MDKSLLLYRYLSAQAAMKTLESGSVKVGRIADFNDPFEWRLGITGIVAAGESAAEAWTQTVVDGMNQWLGILCFSDTHKEPVLWSHYADNHHGVALEFDYLVEPDKLFKMIYSNERPVIEASHARNLDDFKEHMIPIIWRLMKQKSLGWAYEREYRAFVDLGKDCNLSNGMYFRRIPEKSLKRVLLGFKCPLQEKEVREALHSSGLTTTTVARARMCLKSYEILC